jgi:hypothetical protein
MTNDPRARAMAPGSFMQRAFRRCLVLARSCGRITLDHSRPR